MNTIQKSVLPKAAAKVIRVVQDQAQVKIIFPSEDRETFLKHNTLANVGLTMTSVIPLHNRFKIGFVPAEVKTEEV